MHFPPFSTITPSKEFMSEGVEREVQFFIYFLSIYPFQTVLCALWFFSWVFLCVSVCLLFPVSVFSFHCLLLSLLPPVFLLFSFSFPLISPLLHVVSFLFLQDYESKLQALQKQVETRSLAAETTEEEEEEEEGEI